MSANVSRMTFSGTGAVEVVAGGLTGVDFASIPAGPSVAFGLQEWVRKMAAQKRNVSLCGVIFIISKLKNKVLDKAITSKRSILEPEGGLSCKGYGLQNPGDLHI